MQLYTVETGFFKLDGGAMFGVVPKTLWSKIHPADENNLCTWAMRCLLIQEGNRLILVDNGIGDKQDARFFGHYYLHGDERMDKSLAKHGFHRDDITDVLLTHLHFDHCGGSIVREGNRLVPAFKNATYWSNEAHWKWATQPNEREKASFLKENILPIKESGKLKFVDSWPLEDSGHTETPIQKVWSVNDQLPTINFEILSIKIRSVSDHTENMMLPQISYKGKDIVFAADLFPSAGHIPIPYV